MLALHWLAGEAEATPAWAEHHGRARGGPVVRHPGAPVGPTTATQAARTLSFVLGQACLGWVHTPFAVSLQHRQLRPPEAGPRQRTSAAPLPLLRCPPAYSEMLMLSSRLLSPTVAAAAASAALGSPKMRASMPGRIHTMRPPGSKCACGARVCVGLGVGWGGGGGARAGSNGKRWGVG